MPRMLLPRASTEQGAIQPRYTIRGEIGGGVRGHQRGHLLHGFRHVLLRGFAFRLLLTFELRRELRLYFGRGRGELRLRGGLG